MRIHGVEGVIIHIFMFSIINIFLLYFNDIYGIKMNDALQFSRLCNNIIKTILKRTRAHVLRHLRRMNTYRITFFLQEQMKKKRGQKIAEINNNFIDTQRKI